MADFEVTPLPKGSSPADVAIHYILQRTIHDVDFAWHMHGTQTLALCLAAEAARTGKYFETVRTEFKDRDRREHHRRKLRDEHLPRELVLQQKIDELQAELADDDFESEDLEENFFDDEFEEEEPFCRLPGCGVRLFLEDNREIGLCDQHIGLAARNP